MSLTLTQYFQKDVESGSIWRFLVMGLRNTERQLKGQSISPVIIPLFRFPEEENRLYGYVMRTFNL